MGFLKTYEDARTAIFFNPCNHQSMRLTPIGYRFLKNLKVLEYPIDIKATIMPGDLLLLERHLTSLYFVQNLHKLIVFDESTATMLYLMQGDLHTYLSNLKHHT